MSGAVNAVAHNDSKGFNESMIQIVFRIIKYMKPYALIAITGSLLLFINVFFMIKIVLIIKELTDAISVNDMEQVKASLMFYVPFTIICVLLMCIGNFIRAYVQNLVNRDLCVDLFKKVNELPYFKKLYKILI